MTDVWACPSGIATARRPTGLGFRHALLGTVAAGALSLVSVAPALASFPPGCTVDVTGMIETCTGDQSAGVVALPPPVTTLNVNNLTTSIAPASGTSGVTFTSAGDVTINSNTGTFGIATTGNNASGISALGDGAVTVTSIGNISTTGSYGFGILARVGGGSGAATVTSTGNITTAGNGANGIYAYSAGAVTVTSTGNITTAGNGANGMFTASTGAVTVTSTGNITTTGGGFGIFALGGGAVTVTSTGNLTTAGFGIEAYGTSMSGAATIVTSTGNINTTGTVASGILAFARSGAVTVTSTGNIIVGGFSAYGISTRSSGSGAVTVNSTGNITVTGDFSRAITEFGTGTGAVTVTSIGNLSAAGADAIGISAYSQGAAAVAVSSTGNINTTGGATIGIFASSNGGGAVTVNSIGNIKTAGFGTYGIFAFSLGAITVTSAGNISTAGNNATAIRAASAGPIAITIESGTVSGGSGIGAGVALIAGTTNTLTNMGTVTALSGLAIMGDTGNNTVNNSGTVIGNVILGTGANAFNNMAGGVFNAGATVQLGAGNLLTNAGTLSPGGASVIQATTLTGNLVQTATGRLLTDINIVGNSADRINVSGTAKLAGTVQLLAQNLIAGPWQETIVSAAGGATNNGLALLANPVLNAQLVFPNATDVVVKSSGLNFVVAGLNTNQTALGNALNGAAQTSGLGGPVFNLLLNGVTSLPGYKLALTQLSGESATGSQQTTFNAMNSFMGVMTDPFANGRGDGGTPGASAPTGYASTQASSAARDAYAMFTKTPLAKGYDPRWSVWAAGFGGAQSTDGNAAVGSSNTTSSIAGTAVGADYRFSPFTIAGFALAGGGTSFDVGGGGGGRSDLFQAGAFIRHDAGAAYITGALAYGWQDVVTNRTVTLAGFDQLRAEFNANAFSGRLEGGYRFVAPWVGGVGITPYAAGQFTTFNLPAYAENALAGSNAFALSYGAKSVTDPRSELGFRSDKSYAMLDGVLTLRGRLAWAHDYDTNRAIGTTFQSLPGASFVVNGAAQATDSALVTASVEKKWLNGWSAAATFEGEFSDVTRSYAGKGLVRYAW